MIFLSKRKLVSNSGWKGGSESKRWHLSILVFFVAALVLEGGAAQTPCDTADALLNASLYEDARTNYTELLKQNSTFDCAQNGSLALQRAEARNLYEQGLAYEKANQVDAAKTAYADALKKDPNFSNASEALARMNGGVLRNILTLVYNSLTPYVELVVVILILILFIKRILIAFCKPRLDILDFDKGATSLEIGKGMTAMVEEKIKWFETESHKPDRFEVVTGPIEKIEIPVDMKSVSFPIKILSDLIEWLSPSNVITLSGYMEKEGDQGAGITLSLIKTQTGEIIASQTLWQEEFDPAWTLSSAMDTTPEKYYHFVEPIATWTVFNLRLKISPMVGNGFIRKLLCSKISLYDRFNMVIKENPIGNAEDFNVLNTKVWQSYAYFRAGVRWECEGNLDNARKMYLKALNEDPDNVGALLNLGIQYSTDKDYRQALHLLKQAKKFTKQDVSGYSFVWYIAAYQLAVTYYYMAKQYRESLKTVSDKVNALKERIQRVKKQKNNDATLKCFIYAARKDDDILVQNIKINREIVEIILEDFLLEAEKLENYENESKETEVKNLKKVKKDLEDILLFNEENFRETIAAFEKNTAKVSLDDLFTKIDALGQEINDKMNNFIIFKLNMEKAKTEATELLNTLQEAIGESITSEKDAKKSFLKSFKPLAECVHLEIHLENQEKKKLDIDNLVKNIKYYEYKPEVHFNLACCYSVTGEKDKENRAEAYERSLLHLKYAIEQSEPLAQWAQKDPSLRGVGLNEKTRTEFNEIIKKYGGLEPLVAFDSLPLAGITIIGEPYARQLKENEIVSYCDLVLKADTTSARETLAKKLGISTKLFHRWALLADLFRIVEKAKYVNLLEAADYGSIEALSNENDPCKLANLLNQINKVRSIVLQTPTIETVQQWVREAKNTEPKVKLKD